MSQLIVRGVSVQEYKSYCSNNGQRTIELKCRANWTDTVCSEMGWATEPQGFGNGSLEGKLFGISMILEPNKKELKDYRFDIGISQVGSFRHLAKTEDGEVSKRELEFVVTTVADDAHVVLDNYISHVCVGDDRGQAKITYNAEEQQQLPIEEEVGKKRGRRKAAAEA